RLKDDKAAVRAGAAKALGAMGKAGREAGYARLIETLRDADSAVSTAAHEALAQLGAPLAADLAKFQALLTDPSDVVRRFAAESLLQLKQSAAPAADDLIKAATLDTTPEVRKVALQALAAAAPRAPASVAMFRKALSDKDAGVARQAASALAALPA